ncbi:MAG: peroxiredoxin [Bacteroidetes bacterium]|nr:MAG: peroxiredoxin [Bacteroidota bacterium]TAE62619.1 MAG: peroxiredoxin [Bacteroidota bacterium]TAF93849.1 MAG: peroxiredoxin [Bacteroidota bacterium]
MSIQLGSPAPSFTLVSADKKEVSLQDFAGKNVVLLFFPMAFTGVCTAELCNVRDNIASYNNTNATVLGISVDSPFVLDKFRTEQNLNFPLLSDFNKEASTAYNVLYDVFPAFGLKGVSKRAAFVIDGNGSIQYAEVCATPGDLPSFENIQATLAKLA